MGLPQKRKVASWEQRLSEGRRALNWESMMPHSSRSRCCRVAEVLSIRTCRGSRLRLVRLTPLRPRSFRRLRLGHCDRYFRSDSEIRQLLMHRVSRGLFRRLGERQGSQSQGQRWRAEGCGEERPVSPQRRASHWLGAGLSPPLLDGKAGALPGGGGGRSCSHGYDLPLHKMMNYFQCGKQRVNKCHLPMSAYISIWLARIKMFLQDTTS